MRFFSASNFSSFAFICLLPSIRASSPIVDLGYATYQGVFNSSSNTTNFLGIRYAAPPVGKLRFQGPASPLKTTDIQIADTAPISCPTAGEGANASSPFRGLSRREAAPTEDCLFLSVFISGVIDPLSKMPVVFWIHGGGYVTGNATGMSGDDLVKEAGGGIIAITLEYRLGIFGFLPGREVKQKGALNAGLLDQQFALEWIQKYIHLFGGDPRKVTIWGESAGAGSVIQHLIAHGGDTQPPLFRAAMTSSTFLPSQYNFDDPVPEKLYSQVVQLTGCANATDTFACLVEADFDDLENANTVVNGEGFFGTFVMVPVVDGEFIVERPVQTISRERLNGVCQGFPRQCQEIRELILFHGLYDILLSVTNAFEGFFFVSGTLTENQTITDYIAQLMPQFDETQIQQTADVYTGIGLDTVLDQAIAIMGESIFICPTYFILDAFPGRSYKGEFAVPPGLHGEDLQFYFPEITTTPLNNPEFSASFAGAFMAIVKSSDPNVHPPVPGIITPNWDTYSIGKTEMLFNMTEDSQPIIKSITTDTALLQRCEFWKSMAGSIPQ